jgi:hypothetical protein
MLIVSIIEKGDEGVRCTGKLYFIMFANMLIICINQDGDQGLQCTGYGDFLFGWTRHWSTYLMKPLFRLLSMLIGRSSLDCHLVSAHSQDSLQANQLTAVQLHGLPFSKGLASISREQ